MKILTPLSRVMNFTAAGVLAAMMLLTVFDVLLRYAISKPILGTTELTEFMMVCVGFLGLAWCAVQRGHLKVDLVMSRFSPRVQAIFDSATLFIGLGICVFITWRSLSESIVSVQLGSTSSMLEVPDYPFYFILTLGFTILCLVMAIELAQNIARGIKE